MKTKELREMVDIVKGRFTKVDWKAVQIFCMVGLAALLLAGTAIFLVSGLH